jgi:hypothetical protein
MISGKKTWKINLDIILKFYIFLGVQKYPFYGTDHDPTQPINDQPRGSESRTLNMVMLFLKNCCTVYLCKHFFSVADPDLGSGAFLTPGSGIRNRFFPDPVYRIPDPKTILKSFFVGKQFYKSLKIGPNFFLQHFKTKIIYNFVKFVATKKDMTTNFFHLSLLLLLLECTPIPRQCTPIPRQCTPIPRQCTPIPRRGRTLD